jgi:hypothetical protein
VWQNNYGTSSAKQEFGLAFRAEQTQDVCAAPFFLRFCFGFVSPEQYSQWQLTSKGQTVQRISSSGRALAVS